jgi:hypothetical protein
VRPAADRALSVGALAWELFTHVAQPLLVVPEARSPGLIQRYREELQVRHYARRTGTYQGSCPLEVLS